MACLTIRLNDLFSPLTLIFSFMSSGLSEKIPYGRTSLVLFGCRCWSRVLRSLTWLEGGAALNTIEMSLFSEVFSAMLGCGCRVWLMTTLWSAALAFLMAECGTRVWLPDVICCVPLLSPWDPVKPPVTFIWLSSNDRCLAVILIESLSLDFLELIVAERIKSTP